MYIHRLTASHLISPSIMSAELTAELTNRRIVSVVYVRALTISPGDVESTLYMHIERGRRR